MIEDSELLRRYAEGNSEAAFAELVGRHLNFVYAGALRRVGGDAQLAEDVTQQVFVALARAAASLARRPILTGWLYTTTRFASAHVVRAERRRHAREQEAHIMHDISADSSASADWERLRPVLDDTMDELDDRDREAVLMRFFEGRSFAEVGAKLRLTENAVRMRVERALEKLRGALAGRGVTSTAAGLGIALANQTSVAAPAGLAASVTGGALAGAGTAGATFWTSLGVTKIAVAIVGALALGIAGIVTQRMPMTREKPVATVNVLPQKMQTDGRLGVAATDALQAIEPDRTLAAELGITLATSTLAPNLGPVAAAASRGSWNAVGMLARTALAAPSPATAGSHERVQLNVQKVFFAQDGDAIFHAYLVIWKGQEVVVDDIPATTDYGVGENIDVLAMNHPFPQGREGHGSLYFDLLPPFPPRNTVASPTAGATTPSRTTTRSHEELRLEVLKVFSAQDGDALFRAYVVKWKDQEVIASDIPVAMTDYRVGDTISVSVIKLPYPNGKAGPGQLMFEIRPRLADRTARAVRQP